MPAHRSRRACLVFTHQARVADDVDRHDRGEFPRFAHDVLHIPVHIGVKINLA